MTHLLTTLLVVIPTLTYAIDAPTLLVSSSVIGIKRPYSASSNLHNKQSCFLSPYKIQPHNKLLNKRTTIISSLVSPDNNNNYDYCYMPPYGMLPRSNSGIVMNMLVNDYNDDRFRKKMNSKRVKVRFVCSIKCVLFVDYGIQTIAVG